MRLIDVDPMREEVLHNWQNEPVYYANDVLDLIDQQDTVEQPRWIPATELPPNDNEVLVWFEYFRYGSYQRLYRTTGIGRTFRGEWSNFVDGVSGWSSLKILAWMPLPEPPTPEECSAVEPWSKTRRRSDHGD